MQGDEARVLLGFPPSSRPTSDQVKAAYKKKVWESHPDLFPTHEKPCAESRFKLISEAYTYLLSGNFLFYSPVWAQFYAWGHKVASYPLGSLSIWFEFAKLGIIFLSPRSEDDELISQIIITIGTEFACHVDIIGARGHDSSSATYTWVVRRTGTPKYNGGRSNHSLIKIPFLFIILGTIGLGGLNATRAYRKQKEAYPSHNPFLP